MPCSHASKETSGSSKTVKYCDFQRRQMSFYLHQELCLLLGIWFFLCTFLVLSQYFPVLSPNCYGIFLVLLLYFPGIFPVILQQFSEFFPSPVPELSYFYPCIFLMFPLYFPSTVDWIFNISSILSWKLNKQAWSRA